MTAAAVSDHLSLSAPQRHWRAAVSLVLPAAIGVAPAWLALGDVPLCAFKHLTGVPCPLCGGIRVCAALAQGDVAAALALNPGLLVLLAVAGLHGGVLLSEAIAARRLVAPDAFALAWKLALGFLLAAWFWRLLAPA